MTLSKNVLAFLLMAVLFQVSFAAVYKVGDSSGWIVGNIDYNNWASTKNFHVGDVIVFSYNNQFHNVKEVTLQDFQSCNATSPMATYTTGSDSITLKALGHHYFLCGFPGHCQAGQKVDIVVTPVSLRPSASPTPSPNASSPSGSSSPLAAPAPTVNSVSSPRMFKIWTALVTLAVLVNAFAF